MLHHYKNEPVNVQKNLERLFTHGAITRSDRVLIAPVDHGFEHGPFISFEPFPAAYDPEYHFRFAYEMGLSGLAAPAGFLSLCAEQYHNKLPLILKVNSSSRLLPEGCWGQAMTGSVEEALRLGCVGVGVTIYPGCPDMLSMIEDASHIIQQAREAGLFTIVWCYPRGPEITNPLALDVNAYATHIGVLLGAHIIKVKLPESASLFQQPKEPQDSLSARVSTVVRSAFCGKRMVLFSGGSQRSNDEICKDIDAIISGGGHGSMIGQNIFKREESEAKVLVKRIINILNNEPQ